MPDTKNMHRSGREHYFRTSSGRQAAVELVGCHMVDSTEEWQHIEVGRTDADPVVATPTRHRGKDL